MGSKKRIGFVSTRLAGTDGVSLETFKWFQVLERNGYQCFAFAGELATPAQNSLLEPLAHFSHPEIARLHQQCFGLPTRSREVSRRMQELKDHLKKRLYQFVSRFDIDLLIPENALAIPMHIPLGLALTEFLAETGMPAVAHHHDFSWERDRFLVNGVNDYLQYAFPPSLPNIRHVVINSAASRQLSFRRGISNVVIPNVFDFNSPVRGGASAGELRRKLDFQAGELMVLQPTRIVPRKWIERAVELVNLLGGRRPRLVISHEGGDEGDLYVKRVQEFARRHEVELVLIGHMVGPLRSFGMSGGKPYCIGDAYRAADLVTYLSGYEGFGNAFIEAVYFKKPIVVNRYSIFVEDIEPCGFNAIAVDSFVSHGTVERLRNFLEDPRLPEMLEENYRLGERYFSYEVLEARLLPLIEMF